MVAITENQESVLVTTEGPVALIRLNRPEVLNALNYSLMQTLVRALAVLDQDTQIRALVLTGNEKAFAAGADIKELEESSIAEMISNQQMARWDRFRRITKPVIAAVSGFALGGGCELAMACDMIVASETAVFGQPEINIGVIPGAGGTQRLTRALGKYKAMEMVLTGKRLGALEALACGLVNRVVPVEIYLTEAMRLAQDIAQKPAIAVRLAKESVSRALDMNLETALSYERNLFYMLFGTADQKEGMKAFREKRPALFSGK